jgi:hypothetical protein
MTELLLALLLLVPLLALLGFSGCHYEYRYTETRVYLSLHYDPNLQIAGSKVVVNRVDFVVHPADRDDTNTQSLIVGEPPIYDSTGWIKEATHETIDDNGRAVDPIVVDQANGDYLLTMLLTAIYLMPQGFNRWTVTCNAFRGKDDPMPAFPAQGGIEKDLPETGDVFFDFKLDATGNVTPDGT